MRIYLQVVESARESCVGHLEGTAGGRAGQPRVPVRAAGWSGLLVDGTEKPLGELAQLGCGSLRLFLQPHVVLPQVLDLSLQHCLVLLLLWGPEIMLQSTGRPLPLSGHEGPIPT